MSNHVAHVPLIGLYHKPLLRAPMNTESLHVKKGKAKSGSLEMGSMEMIEVKEKWQKIAKKAM